ncbi:MULTISPECIES: hypothetical protein [unclassified Endozoicomonas]|uniref:hypothetical protein n=1 Tax=unclassified Endozoicomonas TaxID=2644528 RepID=UPI0021483BCE|nr:MULTISPECIES: hypothetical protein [unclassified Endozoicomonas]
MNGINNNSNALGLPPSTPNQSLSVAPTGVSMGRDITVYNQSKPSLLNLSSEARSGQSTVLKEEPPLVQDTLAESACAFSRYVSLHNEIKVDSSFLSNVETETLDPDIECISERSFVKTRDTSPCPLELSINELRQETLCHSTRAVLEKNFSKSYSTSYIFTVDDQDIYKTYINGDPENDYLFVHKLICIFDKKKECFHDFVIHREDNNFHILQSMANAFSLEEWITGDSDSIIEKQKKFKRDNDLILLHRENHLPPPFSKDDENMVIMIKEELKNTKPSFDKIVKARINKPCSKAIFNQKILPTLFSALRNSGNHPYFRIFSVSRRYLDIKPEYNIFLEVYYAKL